MKYKVAIVDDESSVCKSIAELLKKYADNMSLSEPVEENLFEITTFACGDDLLSANIAEFDMFFLDINMPGANGLKTAKCVRCVNTTAVIIFCTNYAQYAVNGYEVNALGYIVKPIQPIAFCRTMDRAMTALGKNAVKRVRIKTVDGVELLLVSNILYAEIQLHNLFFHVLDADGKVKVYRTRGSMQETENSFADMDFARCSACYLVNLNHVLSVNKGNVNMRGGASLPVSRKFAKDFSDKLLSFLGSRGTVNV